MLAAVLIVSLQVTPPAPVAGGAQRELKMDMQLDAAFLAAADTDRNGALSLDEYQAEMDRRLDAAIARNPAAKAKIGPEQRSAIREKMLAPSFRGFDKNSDRSLTRDEVSSFAQEK